MMYNSPLEQFEIISLINLNIGVVDFSFTNSAFFILFLTFCIWFFIIITNLNKGGTVIPNRYQSFIENFYSFTATIVYENIGEKGNKMIPFIFSLFFFLLLCNVCGLVPYSFTVTSHLIVTFILSLIVWVGKLFIGFKHHGIKLLGVLIPEGLPFIMVPFFVLVELISFIIPLAALGIRLFANIISGHILLKVIVGFCWTLMIGGGFSFIVHFFPLFILFLLLFLETAVACIQAYVFTILTCLITGDIIKGSH